MPRLPDPTPNWQAWLEDAAEDVISDTESALATSNPRPGRKQWAALREQAIQLGAERHNSSDGDGP